MFFLFLFLYLLILAIKRILRHNLKMYNEFTIYYTNILTKRKIIMEFDKMVKELMPEVEETPVEPTEPEGDGTPVEPEGDGTPVEPTEPE